MLPVLRAIAGHRRKSADLPGEMATQFHLTSEERETLLPSGRDAVIDNRTHWALAYLNKHGLITRVARGLYEVSERGDNVLKNPPDRITIRFLKQFPPIVTVEGNTPPPRTVDSNPSLNENQDATPEERIEIAAQDLRQELAVALLDQVRSIAPSAFERLIIDLLLKIGYGGSRQEAARHLGRSGDGGIDGVIREDAFGLDTIYLQAKRYAEDNAISAPVIQSFAGALLGNGATKGVFVTTSRFTRQAQDAAAGYKTHRIVLIDGEELARLMIEYEIGVRTIQTIRIQRIELERYEVGETAL